VAPFHPQKKEKECWVCPSIDGGCVPTHPYKIIGRYPCFLERDIGQGEKL